MNIRIRALERRGQRGFTLIELLVVVSLISLLIGLLLPALSRARAHAKMTGCMANLRSQSILMLTYTNDYEGGLPPKFSWELSDAGPSETLLINRFLARYNNEVWTQPDDDSHHMPPDGWRCPDVPPSQDQLLRWTHSGILHHAPNSWLFNNVQSVYGEVSVDADAPDGWCPQFCETRWRTAEQVRFPDQIIAMSCNINTIHQDHREAQEHIGRAWELIIDPDFRENYNGNVGSHERLRKRPASFVDGHAEAMPSTPSFWHSKTNRYEKPSGGAADLYENEVRHLMWMVQ